MLARVLEAAKLYIVRVTKGVYHIIKWYWDQCWGQAGGQIISIINLFWLIDILTWILPSSSLMTGGSWSSLYYWVSSSQVRNKSLVLCAFHFYPAQEIGLIYVTQDTLLLLLQSDKLRWKLRLPGYQAGQWLTWSPQIWERAGQCNKFE